MNSVYEVLKAQGVRHMKLVGAIQCEMPNVENLARDVDTKWGRGGFIHTPKVGTDRSKNKASLFVTLRDTKVDQLTKDAEVLYGWTCIKVAQYENGKFVRTNSVWSMVLTKEQFQALVTMGCVDPASDPKKAVVVDFRNARLFPEVESLSDFYGRKIEQLRREAKADKLESLRTAARTYFKKGGITFPELTTRAAYGSSDTELETVYAYYSAFTVELPNEEIDAAVDESLYRTNIAEGNAKKFTYTREQYIALDKAHDEAKAEVKAHAEEVRLMELALLEQYNGKEVIESESGPIKLVINALAKETYRAKPEEIARWSQANAHRLAPSPQKKVAATPSPSGVDNEVAAV